MSYFCIKYGLDPRIIFSTNYPSNTQKVISNDIKHCLATNTDSHFSGNSDSQFHEENQIGQNSVHAV